MDSFWDELLRSAGVCGSKGSVPVSKAQAAEMARYQQLAQQQPADWNGYSQDLARAFETARKAIGDNQYKGEMGSIPEKVVPQIVAKELTKEELRKRVERKLDLMEAGAIDVVDTLNHGRWRQVMDEVFRDDNQGGDDGKAEEDGTVSSGRGHRGEDGG